MKRSTATRLLVAAVITCVGAAIVGAVAVLGPPEQQRQRHLDERRVRDLTTIAGSISLYASTHDTLPTDLSALGRQPGPRRAPFDPDTGAAYEYAVLGVESYQLCAVFALPTPDAAPRRYVGDEEWTHGAGRQCFERRQKVGRN